MRLTRIPLLCVALATLAARAGHAQSPSPAPRSPFSVTVELGTRVRNSGAGFLADVGFRAADFFAPGWSGEVQLGLSQVPEWYWSGGQRFQQRENSLELALAGGHDVGRAIHGTVSADAAVVLAASLGCTVGEFSNNYGDAGCVNSFARDGSVRAGLRLRLIDTWTTARARPYAGVSVSGGTIAAGRGVSFGLFAGVAIPYFR